MANDGATNEREFLERVKHRCSAEAEAGELTAFWPQLETALDSGAEAGSACEAALRSMEVRPEISWQVAQALLEDREASAALRIIHTHCLQKGWLMPSEVMWTALINADDMTMYKTIHDALGGSGFFVNAASSQGVLGEDVPPGKPSCPALVYRLSLRSSLNGRT